VLPSERGISNHVQGKRKPERCFVYIHGMAPAGLMAYTASFELIKPGCLLNRSGFKQLSTVINGGLFFCHSFVNYSLERRCKCLFVLYCRAYSDYIRRVLD
jgi:hypothetical protein